MVAMREFSSGFFFHPPMLDLALSPLLHEIIIQVSEHIAWRSDFIWLCLLKLLHQCRKVEESQVLELSIVSNDVKHIIRTDSAISIYIMYGESQFSLLNNALCYKGINCLSVFVHTALRSKVERFDDFVNKLF